MICNRLVATVMLLLVVRGVPFLSGCVHADELTILSSDESALEARFSLIDQAEVEICLATYTIDDSVLVKELTEHLGRKAKAGVRVRVIVDGLASSRYPSTVKALCDDGVEVRIYHPLGRGRPDWLNRRMHSKLLVVDRVAMVVGSRNMVDKHFGLSSLNFVDIDALVVGECSCVASNYFDKLWDSPDVLPPFNLVRFSNSAWIECEGAITMSELSKCDINSSLEHSSMAATCQLLPQQVCVLHDDLGVAARAGTISKKIDQIIDAAQQSIVIETPYPAFSSEFFGRLRAAVNRGVMVTLITNSLRSTNQVEVFAAYQNQKSRLLQMGVQIYEYRGPDHLHAKAMIVDDRLAMLGSYNFDARSERLNLELCLLTHNPTAVMLIREAIGFHQCQTKAICTVSESDTLNDASLMRRLRMRTAQFIVPLLRPAL